MISRLTINGKDKQINASPSERLITTLRKAGYYSIKFGDEHSLSGMDTVLLDGRPVNAGTLLTKQAEGHLIVTVEGLGDIPDQGWKKTEGLHPIQEAFISTGAIQCGYCTPAQILAAKSLLDQNPDPNEYEVREALSGVLCRCTGYQRPVEAVLLAASKIRNKKNNLPNSTRVVKNKSYEKYTIIGTSAIKTDAIKLAQGKPSFTADIHMEDMLHAKVLFSPHAHALIKKIDTSKAVDLPGVAAVLTWKDIPRVIFSTAGQSDPIPGPLDTFSLDKKVRFVGDRVAFVAAETPEIATEAIKLIEVEYELLDTILDPSESQLPDSPILHDETEFVNFADSDPRKNLAAKIRIDIGDVEKGFSEADEIFEADYTVSKVQQAHLEPHVVVTYWDEDDRLTIRTSTQVPFHIRRVLAPVLGLPVKRIRVIKPRIGGGFGGKQEIMIEDVAAHLTIATKKPVLYEYSREDEFTSSRSRHPMKIHMKTGYKKDGTICANEMTALSDTGAYGCHALTVTGNTGHKSLALYVGDGKYRVSPNIRFHADVVYTNTSPAGAFRGYGVPQGYWPLERHMEQIARKLKMDPFQFRLKNSLREGEYHPFSTAWNEGREPRPEIIHTVGLSKCVEIGAKEIDWKLKYQNPKWQQSCKDNEGSSSIRKGIGTALVMQGTAIPYLDMGGASLKLNDDGSFNLLVGATDLGTGSDTVLAQMAAEVLGVSVEDFIVYSSDTDFTPFDKGAYASSTTYVSGGAVVQAANIVAERIKTRAATLLNESDISSITLKDRKAVAGDGRSISLADIALSTLHHFEQEQIMGVSSFVAESSPPPFGAQFAEVSVDIETGQIQVDRLVMVVDSGRIVNPDAAFGQIEGGMIQAMGYAICEDMTVDQKGNPLQKNFYDYHILRSNEIPELKTIFVETQEPSHPYGVKAAAEIPMDGVAPAIGNAILDAIGVNINTLPITPEKVWAALNNNSEDTILEE
ncbi:molybdopterin-dependent oxidoreductase [Chloroflexota bacterium]